VRDHNLRNVLIAAGALLGVAASCLGIGYWLGHRLARAEISDTEAGLRVAFANGPEAAREWWWLMAAQGACEVPGAGGKRAARLRHAGLD
jgi:hypothetical protein